MLCQREEFSILKNRDGGEIAELTCMPIILSVACERSKTNKLKGGISPPIVAESNTLVNKWIPLWCLYTRTKTVQLNGPSQAVNVARH